MGGMTIVVIGDDWRDQLDRYQSLEYAEASNRHIVKVDRLQQALKAYPGATKSKFRLPDGREVDDLDEVEPALMKAGIPLHIVHHPLNGELPFPAWASKQFGVRPLAEGALPDLEREHRFGWIRQDAAGQVTELVQCKIPGAFFFYLRGTSDDIVLKPGGVGWIVGQDDQVTEVTTGRCGSARLRDIDFAAMRDDPHGFWPYDVICHGKHLENPDTDALLASLAPDTLITSVYAKC
jgi:hypothetical protein